MQRPIDYFAYSFVNSTNYQYSILESLRIALKKSIQLFSASLVQKKPLQVENIADKPVQEEGMLLQKQLPQNYQQIRPQNTAHDNSIIQNKNDINKPNFLENTKNIALNHEHRNIQKALTVNQKLDILKCPNPKISKKINRCELRIPWRMMRNPSTHKKIQKIKRIKLKKSLIPTADISNHIPMHQILLKRNDILSRRLPTQESLLFSRKRSRQLAYLFS